MYKVIHNRNALDKFEKESNKETSILFSDLNIRSHLQTSIDCLDNCYGAKRDIRKDLGGYAIILYGSRNETYEEYTKVLEYHHLYADGYEWEEIFNGPECDQKVTSRLYLCSSDYSVLIILIERCID